MIFSNILNKDVQEANRPVAIGVGVFFHRFLDENYRCYFPFNEKITMTQQRIK
jgi:hypothetical protein